LNKNSQIKIIALGGVGEMGKNMFLVEVDEEIFVIDAGLMFPEDEMLGIDIVIPDVSYLLANKERVKGIFLTHGHEDHIGALAYILKELDVPVYGTKLTIALTKLKMAEQDFKGKVDFHTIHSNSVLTFSSAKVSFFKVNHSIPDSVGVCIHTSEGGIVYTSDFKFDQAASKLYQSDMSKMALLGEKGVLCLLSDSTEAEKPGYTTSEAIVAREMESVFESANGRIIYACYASNINGVQHVLNAAKKTKRKVVIVGRTLLDVYQTAKKLGYLTVHEDLVISLNELEKYKDREIVILMSGAQGEPLEALQKMAKQMHRHVNIKKGDSVLIAASPHRGGELFLIKTVDMLYRAGAVVLSNRKTIHVSGHGRQEELRLMINLMKPKFFIPVHGEYRMLQAHAKIAKSCGIKEENIYIPEKGEILLLSSESIQSVGRVPSGNILIDGIGVGDVGNIVLRDRRLLSQDGIFIVVVSLDRKEKKIVSGPEIISRGFVYVRESEKLMEESTKIVREIVEKNMTIDVFEWSGIKQEIRDQLHSFLFEKTKRRPMIIPIIMEI